MTVNKRFVLYEHKGADYILDTPNTELDFIEMLGDCLDEKEIVDLLNTFHEENEQLKSENALKDMRINNITAQRDEFYRGARENANRVRKLKKENEQLKQSNKWLRANRKDCEKGRIDERKNFEKFDKSRVEHIRFLQKRLKENGLSIYKNE